MKITRNEIEFKEGRYYVSASLDDLTIHDDIQKTCILTQTLSNQELEDLARCLIAAKKYREDVQEIKLDDLRYEADHEIEEMYANSL